MSIPIALAGRSCGSVLPDAAVDDAAPSTDAGPAAWYDRIDSRVIIGALPLKRQLDTLARIEGVTGVINCCDEFGGHAAEYGRYRMRELRTYVDYCSPTAQQIELGLGFISKQPPGGTRRPARPAACCDDDGLLMSSGLDAYRGAARADGGAAAREPQPVEAATVREMHRRNQQRQLMQRCRETRGQRRRRRRRGRRRNRRACPLRLMRRRASETLGRCPVGQACRAAASPGRHWSLDSSPRPSGQAARGCKADRYQKPRAPGVRRADTIQAFGARINIKAPVAVHPRVAVACVSFVYACAR